MNIEIVELDRFQASDPEGNIYTVIATQEILISETHDGTYRIPSKKHLRTSSGDPLNFIDENTFDHVKLRVRLHRI